MDELWLLLCWHIEQNDRTFDISWERKKGPIRPLPDIEKILECKALSGITDIALYEMRLISHPVYRAYVEDGAGLMEAALAMPGETLFQEKLAVILSSLKMSTLV